MAGPGFRNVALMALALSAISLTGSRQAPGEADLETGEAGFKRVHGARPERSVWLLSSYISPLRYTFTHASESEDR